MAAIYILKFISRGQDITIGQLQESIKARDKTELKALLEELLLIPVDNKEIMKVLKIKSYDNSNALMS